MKREEGDTNRIIKLKPRRGKFWCMVCDAFLISSGQRCPRCGHRSLPRRLKK